MCQNLRKQSTKRKNINKENQRSELSTTLNLDKESMVFQKFEKALKECLPLKIRCDVFAIINNHLDVAEWLYKNRNVKPTHPIAIDLLKKEAQKPVKI